MKQFLLTWMVCCAALTIQAQTTWTVAGDQALLGSNWDPWDANNLMTEQADGTFMLTKENVTLAANTEYKFKVCGDHSWDHQYGNNGGDAILKVAEDGVYSVRFTFNATTKAVAATATKTGDVVVERTWTVAGDSVLMGSNWKPEDTENDMLKQADGTYLLVKVDVTLQANYDYKYKVCANHQWGEAYGNNGGDAILRVNVAGVYDVTFTFNPTTKAVNATTELSTEIEVEKTWTVAGDSVLMGSNWKPEDATNDMQEQADGTFLLEKTDRVLAIGTYKFKVCANHQWGEEYGVDGGDATINILEDGIYKVVFTFNPTTKAVAANATKTGDAVADRTWTVAGDSVMMGSNWNPEDKTNDMTLQADGNYMLVKQAVALTGPADYKFKVCANHQWAEAYGQNGGDGIITINETGVYDLTFIFNPITKEVTATATTGTTAVENITIDENTVFYNIYGQRVDANTKGILITNGVKIIRY